MSDERTKVYDKQTDSPVIFKDENGRKILHVTGLPPIYFPEEDTVKGIYRK